MLQVGAHPTGRARIHGDAAERPVAEYLQGDLLFVLGQRGQGKPGGDCATQGNRGHSAGVVPARNFTHRLGGGHGHHAGAAIFEKTANDLVVVGHVVPL